MIIVIQSQELHLNLLRTPPCFWNYFYPAIGRMACMAVLLAAGLWGQTSQATAVEICFFTEPDFQGTQRCTQKTGNFNIVAENNDKYSSVSVSKGAKVTIFSERDQAGERCTFRESEKMFTNSCDNMASSVRISLLSGIELAETARREAENVDCSSYTSRALAQVKEAKKNDCSFSGNRWATSADSHIRWCATASADAVNSETAERDRLIKDCVKKQDGAIVPYVCMYVESDFDGTRQCFNEFGEYAYIGDKLNDKISAVAMLSGIAVEIYTDRDLAGDSATLTCALDGKIPKYMDGEISSFIIRKSDSKRQCPNMLPGDER
jgi:Peptidase inhibitor family I36